APPPARPLHPHRAPRLRRASAPHCLPARRLRPRALRPPPGYPRRAPPLSLQGAVVLPGWVALLGPLAPPPPRPLAHRAHAPPPRPNPSRRPPAGAASPVRLPGPPRAPAPQPARPAPPTAAARSSEGSLSDARIKELHARYLASRQGAAGQPVPLEKLAQSLR